MKTVSLGSLAVIDPMRVGGPLSGRKHAFMAQGEVGGPVLSASVSPEEESAIQDSISAFLGRAQDAMTEVIEDGVSALDQRDAELLGQARKEAKAINDLVGDFMTSTTIRPYISEDAEAFATDISDARSELESAIEQAPFAAKDLADEESANRLQDRIDPLRELQSATERLVVTVEGSRAGVAEPGEKLSDGIMPLVGLGLIAAAAYALYEALA